MEIYRSGRWKLTFSPEMVRHLKEHQRDFMPEDTKAGMIQAFLDSYPGDTVCSKCITGWNYFSNPRMFAGYGRQKGWERENARTEPATDSGNGTEKIPEGFTPVPEQMELPF